MRVLISIYCWIAGVIIFVWFLLSALFCSFIFPERIYNPWLKKILRFLFVAIGTKVEVEGLENLTPGASYLFMANHVSMFDMPLLGGFLPGITRAVEAHSHSRWPLYGLVMRRLGNIPIERESIHGSVASFRKTLLHLNNGKSMTILPEGHRTLNGEIQAFKKLPFLLAKQIDKGIVPIGISGLFRLKPKGTWIIQPTTLKISFGKVIPKEEIDALSVLELREHVRNEIIKRIERP